MRIANAEMYIGLAIAGLVLAGCTIETAKSDNGESSGAGGDAGGAGGPVNASGCSTDQDCKASRICQQGTCVDVDGGGAEVGGGSNCACVPGTTIACQCGGGALGVQACNSDCVSYATCDCTDPDAGPPFKPPSIVTIALTDALISPGKADGTTWDGTGSVSAQDMSKLATALGAANPYAAAVGVISSIAMSSWDKPDPYGTCELWYASQWQFQQYVATRDNNTEDTFTPIWPGSPGWMHVPVDTNMRFRVSLKDEDISSDDDIGVAEIGYDEIMNAVKSQSNYHVKVADTPSGQLLFVGFSVTVEQ